jgi:hypothetical protein
MKNIYQFVGAGVVAGLVSLWFGIIYGLVSFSVVYFGLKTATKQTKSE